MTSSTQTEFLGYRRENGEVGIRNRVALLAVDHAGAIVVQAVEKIIYGVTAVPHHYGRLQFGEDLDLMFDQVIGTGANPDVAATVVVGIEPAWTQRVADGILKRMGKPVETVHVIGKGTLRAIEEAARHAHRLVIETSEFRREPMPISDLVAGIKCGASDTTSGMASNPALGVAMEKLIDLGGTVIFGESTEMAGGEHIVARRAINEGVAQEYLKVIDEYVEFAKAKGVNIMGSQPTEENIAGGLSTIEEKALGNIQKIPDRPLRGVLKAAEPPPGKGLYFMDSSSSGQEQVTLCAAGGAAVHLFTTGQGNTAGHQILPVIKITANPKTATTMPDNIDVDISAMLSGEMSLEEAGERVFDNMVRVLSGRLTAAEVLGHSNFALNRTYKSM